MWKVPPSTGLFAVCVVLVGVGVGLLVGAAGGPVAGVGAGLVLPASVGSVMAFFWRPVEEESDGTKPG